MIRVDSDTFVTPVCLQDVHQCLRGPGWKCYSQQGAPCELGCDWGPHNRGTCGSEKAPHRAQEGRCCGRCSGRRPLWRIWPLRVPLRSHSRSSGGWGRGRGSGWSGCTSDGRSSSRRGSSAEARNFPCRGCRAEQVHSACSIYRPAKKHSYLHALAASFVWRPAGASCHMARVLAVLS